MKPRLLCITLAVVAALAVISPWAWAQDGLEGALPRADLASPLNLAAPFDQKLAIADFDNDHKPDGAVLLGFRRLAGQNSFRIELHLSHSNNTELAFESPEASLAITAWDINKDGTADVVVEQPLTHKRLYVWLGDGHGGFHKGRIEDFPSAQTTTDPGLESPSPPPDCPAVCVGPQRGAEIGTVTARSLLRRAPPVLRFKALPIISNLASPASAPDASRAPPLFS